MLVVGSYNVAMLQKKLFAAACAMAIVGVGACFLPPGPVPHPPLPPYLVQIRSFYIQVQDASNEDRVDGVSMSRAVASNFNELWKDFAVRAKSGEDSRRTDATLRITVEQKYASFSTVSRGKQQWIFDLRTSATLTAADGRLLWQKQNQISHFAIWLENGLPPDRWNSRGVRQHAAYSLAMTAGDLLHGSSPIYSPERHP